jgi:hypothetical protein
MARPLRIEYPGAVYHVIRKIGRVRSFLFLLFLCGLEPDTRLDIICNHCWPESIAVGNLAFVESVRSELDGRALHRDAGSLPALAMG